MAEPVNGLLRRQPVLNGLLGPARMNPNLQAQGRNALASLRGTPSPFLDPEFYTRDLGPSAASYFSEPENALRALSVAPVPVLSDVAGLAADALMYKNKPEERNMLNFGLTGLGALPFLPAMAGMIKSSGKLTKDSIFGLPADVAQQLRLPVLNTLPYNPRYDSAGGVFEDMAVNVKSLQNGDYAATYNPQWLRGGQGRYAVGDNPDELIDSLLQGAKKSDAGVKAAQTKNFNQSLIGQLSKLGFNPDDFREMRSARSESRYIVHGPSGTKIRISDHDLPLHYERPDVDLRSSMTDAEKIAAINAALK